MMDDGPSGDEKDHIPGGKKFFGGFLHFETRLPELGIEIDELRS
jgi:hypothetical protein